MNELIDTKEPAWNLVQKWLSGAAVPYEVVPCARGTADEALLATQVTTRSPMGAIVYHCAGILVDSGWLRFLGAGGHDRFRRSLPGWNQGRSDGFYLVADDAIGGYFALNGGAFGPDRGKVYYFAPEALEWQALELGYSQFLAWSLSGALGEFYADQRWNGWEVECRQLTGDRVFSVYPFLWAQGPPIGERSRRVVPVEEWFDLQLHLLEQVERATADRPGINGVDAPYG